MGKNRVMGKIVLLIVFALFFTACAPSTKFWPTTDYSTDKISSQNIINLKKINMQGDLNYWKTSFFSSFITGFKKHNDTIELIYEKNREVNYSDLELLLKLNTKSSISAFDYVHLIPLVGLFTKPLLSGSMFDFYWDITVNYEFMNHESMLVDNGSFELKGKDIYQPTQLDGMTIVLGTGFIVASYPQAHVQKIIGETLFNVVGEEIAKRLSSAPVKTYLAQREKQRDGMDVKTYVEFMEKKKRLEKEREIAKVERLKELDVQVKSRDQLADIKSGTVMVLGIGVSKYQSSKIPGLKYADRDSQRVVKHFKDRYKLSDDRAMLLTNEEATAIKISRFITQNAAKLLSKDDTFILYFGGHGAPDVDATSNDNDGLKKYLLLHDSELDSLPMTALSLNNLAALLEKLPCKRVVILLDSCFAGTAGVQTLAKLKSLRVSEKSYKNIADMSGEGRVILAASSENQVSHEEDALQAGVFTHYLLEGLNGKADLKGDGKINILGLYEYVSREVSKYTQQKQSPVFRGTLDSNIVF